MTPSARGTDANDQTRTQRCCVADSGDRHRTTNKSKEDVMASLAHEIEAQRKKLAALEAKARREAAKERQALAEALLGIVEDGAQGGAGAEAYQHLLARAQQVVGDEAERRRERARAAARTRAANARQGEDDHVEH